MNTPIPLSTAAFLACLQASILDLNYQLAPEVVAELQDFWDFWTAFD